MKYAKEIPYFRGVYMKDDLPRKPRSVECGIINLDDSYNNGTHWVAYIKFNDYYEYFDSFGDLKPPAEVLKYLNTPNLYYNYTRYQKYDSVNCGHLCLKFLIDFWNKRDV